MTPDLPFRMAQARTGWRSRALLAAIAALGMAATPLAAQDTGTVSGRVVAAGTGEPIASAQVQVVGTNRQTLTDQAGNYTLAGVTAGSQQVQARAVGHRMETRAVQVGAGATARVNFSLTVAAVLLDQVVVTGQATGTARREVGASVVSIDMADLEGLPITTTTQLLQSRVPGVTIMPSGGNAGQGSRIVMRGPGSLSQSVEPIIYVDGIRIDNSKVAGTQGGGASWTGLDDINPEDIERIEIVKGAAAATMYGSEASGGVIQIFTKRGRGATQRYSMRTDYGFSQTPLDWWDVSVYGPWFHENFIRTGRQFLQTLGVTGSVEGFSYNLSGTYRRNDGVLPSSWENNGSFRANMTFTPTDRFSLDVNTSYNNRTQRQPEGGNNSWNLAMNALRGGPRGTSREPELLEQRELLRNSSRFVAGMGASFSPRHNFTHRVNVGFDVVNWDNLTLLPFGSDLTTVDGSVTNYRRGANTFNVEYAGSFRHDISDAIRSNTAFGLQHFDKSIGASQASGSRFGAPGLRTVAATAGTSGWESRLWEKTGGFYFEQQLGLHDRFFVTGGARFDGHSAFGADAGYAFYPKLDASYVVSAHDFWPENAGTLRLRSAYGTAGKQPGHFDAETTWNPVTALEGVPAVSTGNLGNPNLGPEVSHEFEFGFDAGLLDDRVGVEYTRYRQRTRDALFQVRYPPSRGFLATQLENVGLLANDGHELAVRAAVIETRNLRANLRGSMALNRNEVLSLGGGAPFNVQWTQWIREGYPAGGFFEDRYILVDGAAVLASEHYTIRDANGNPVLDDSGEIMRQEGWDYIGPAFPTREFNLGGDVGLGRSLTLTVLGNFRGGHFVESATSRWLNFDGGVVQLNDPLYDPDDPATAAFAPGSPTGRMCMNVAADVEAGRQPDPIWEATCNTHWSVNRGNHVLPADNWRLREVALSYRMPREFVQNFGASGAMLSLAGRNLLRWQKYPGTEAEANYNTGGLLVAQTYFDTPLPRQVVASISVNF